MADGAFPLKDRRAVRRLSKRGRADEKAGGCGEQRQPNLQSDIFNLKSHGSKV